MGWGTKAKPLGDHFRGGKYVPRHVRPVSVPLQERDPAEISEPGRRSAASFLHAATSGPVQLGTATELSEEERAEDALLKVQQDVRNESMVEESAPKSGLVEHRRLVINVLEATNLPIMDDEAGMTCDPYVVLRCGKSEAKTKHKYRTLDPEWKEKHVLKLPLTAEHEDFAVTVMDYDESAHDTVGSFSLVLGSKTDPFPTVENKYTNHNITMTGVLSTATFHDWYELCSPEGKTVRGLQARTSLLHLHVQHVHEVRDVRFRPSPRFMQACAKSPGQRSSREIRFMAREVITQMPAAALLSSRTVYFICSVAQLKQWKKYDIVQLQNSKPTEDSLHLVLSGTFNLYAQEQGPNASMYRVLKGRSFGPQTSFGPQIGWCGPGEGFGQAALYMHEGVSSTSVCVSDNGGMTLLIDRRECERIMEQFVRKESGFAPSMHGRLLAEKPKSPSTINILNGFFKHFDCKLFHGISDDLMNQIVEKSELVELQAGDMLEQTGEHLYVVCYGTLSAHSCIRSDEIHHLMPIQGECTDVLGPGNTIGACGHVDVNVRARECTQLVRIHKATLVDMYSPGEPFPSEVLAAGKVEHERHGKVSSPKVNKWGAVESGKLPEPLGAPSRPHVDSEHYTTCWSNDGPFASKYYHQLHHHHPRHHHHHHHHHQSKKGLLYTLHIFHWLRSLQSLQNFETDILWYLVQKITVCCLHCNSNVYTQGFALVLDGMAKVKESVSSEKPSQASLFNAGRGVLIKPGSQIVSEANGADYITVLMWSVSFWEYVQNNHATRDLCRMQLTIGQESKPQQSDADLIKLLKNVPLLEHVPEMTLREWFLTNICRRVLPGNSIITTEGEEDFSLYIVAQGTVVVFKDRDSDDLCMTAGILGLDTLQASFGASEQEHRVGECFGQGEFMLGSSNSFTAVCKGPCEILMLDRAAISKPEIESMIWLSLQGSSILDKHEEAHAEGMDLVPIKSFMEQEIRALQTYSHAKTHRLCDGLSTRSAIFLCTHLRTQHVDKDDLLTLRSENSVSIAALITGQMVVHPVFKAAIPPDKPTFGHAICSLRAGDIYDPHLTKIEDNIGSDTKADQVALAREKSECYVIEAAKYRAAIKKNMRDSALHARRILQRDLTFNNLPSFTFDRLSKLARLTHHQRDDTIFRSTHTAVENIIFLADGEFKVTKKTAMNPTVARLGPGMHFGGVGESADKMSPQTLHSFAVFAATGSITMQLPVREIVQLLPDGIVRKLRNQLDKDTKHIVSKMRMHEELESPAAQFVSSPKLKTLITDSSAGIPARQQQKGIVGLPEYQSTYCSGNMTLFFENVARDKVIPYPEDESEEKPKVGRPPEEILPSLRAGFVQRKLDEINRKAQLDFLKPQDVSAILSQEQLAKRAAKITGVNRLHILQPRIDKLRNNSNLREQLAERVVGHKRDIVDARSGSDWTAHNRKVITDKTLEEKRKEERRKKEEEIRDAMDAQKQTNEQHWKEKIDRTMVAMNRKELNDENHLEHLKQILHRTASKRRIAVMLMTCALAARMESWCTIFVKIRRIRGILLLWSSAAVTLQRKWREYMYAVVKVRKENAALKITGFFMRVHWQQKSKRRVHAAPIIATFLRELIRSMKDVRYQFRLFQKRVTFIQRRWRTYRRMAETWYQTLMVAWDKLEPKFRKGAAAETDAKLPGGRKKAAAPTPPRKDKKSTPKIPKIPHEIKWRHITQYVRKLRREHRDRKLDWLQEYGDWTKREHGRRMLQEQKELLQREMGNDESPATPGGVEAEDPTTSLLRATPYTKENARLKNLLFMDPLSPSDDPPPTPPIFNPVPAEAELLEMMRLANEDSIEASRTQRAAAAAAPPPPPPRGTNPKKR